MCGLLYGEENPRQRTSTAEGIVKEEGCFEVAGEGVVDVVFWFLGFVVIEFSSLSAALRGSYTCATTDWEGNIARFQIFLLLQQQGIQKF